MAQRNQLIGIFIGILALIGMHILLGLVILSGGLLVGRIVGGYSIFSVWFYGATGFFIWQLIYVLPMVIWLRRRRNLGIMKGVIIGAALTALLNGGCFLSMR